MLKKNRKSPKKNKLAPFEIENRGASYIGQGQLPGVALDGGLLPTDRFAGAVREPLRSGGSAGPGGGPCSTAELCAAARSRPGGILGPMAESCARSARSARLEGASAAWCPLLLFARKLAIALQRRGGATVAICSLRGLHRPWNLPAHRARRARAKIRRGAPGRGTSSRPDQPHFAAVLGPRSGLNRPGQQRHRGAD